MSNSSKPWAIAVGEFAKVGDIAKLFCLEQGVNLAFQVWIMLQLLLIIVRTIPMNMINKVVIEKKQLLVYLFCLKSAYSCLDS